MDTPAHRLPPLQTLAAFEAVARLESFARAAEELSVTHSAVSHRIRLLESHLGTRLFLRLSKRVVLTPQGREFLASVVAALDLLKAGAATVARTGRRTLKLTTFPAFAQGWLVRRIDGFLRRHDDIELELDATPHLVNLKAGAADVAIRYGKGDWEGLESKLLMPEYVEAVCSPGFRRRHGGLREPKDLAGVPLLRHTVLKWTPWFRSGGLDWPEPARGPKYNDGSVMLEAAADGQGVALARSLMLEPYLASGRLESPFDVRVLSDYAYYLVYPRAARSRSEVAAFIYWITAEAKQETAQAPKTG